MDNTRERVMEIIRRCKEVGLTMSPDIADALIAAGVRFEDEYGFKPPQYKKGQTVWLVYTTLQKEPIETVIEDWQYNLMFEIEVTYLAYNGRICLEWELYPTEEAARAALEGKK